MIEKRLYIIYKSASRLFIKNRYSRTKINHISKDTEISVGTIYNLFISKKAILNFIFKCNIDKDFFYNDFDFPINENMFYNIESEIKSIFYEVNKEFSDKFLVSEETEFNDMVNFIFDIFSRYKIGILILKENFNDCGFKSEFYLNYKNQFIDTVIKCLTAYDEKGKIDITGDIRVNAIYVIESIAFWSMYLDFDDSMNDELIIEEKKNLCTQILERQFNVR